MPDLTSPNGHNDHEQHAQLPNDDRQLVMDILRYGADCEVLGPKSLREAVRRELREAAAGYR